MHFIRAGAGAPPFLFVHGFGCDHTDWQQQIASFSARHAVVACDLRGHGDTPGRPHECSIPHYGGDVAALAANLDLSGAILVGHSMGCRVVLEAARLEPERFAGLVLIDGSRQGTGDADAAERLARERIADDAFLETFFSQMFLQASAQSRALVARALRLPKDVRIALFGNMARWDAAELEDALAAVRAPVLVIQTTYLDEQRVRRSLEPGRTTPWLELLAARLKDVRIEVLPGLGHFPQLEAPGAINPLLTEFAARARLPAPRSRP